MKPAPSILVWLLDGLLVWLILAGLWQHDWRMIVAGVLAIVILVGLGDELVDDPTKRPADPYGDCLAGISILVLHALSHEGGMTEVEKRNLIAFEEYMRVRDNS